MGTNPVNLEVYILLEKKFKHSVIANLTNYHQKSVARCSGRWNSAKKRLITRGIIDLNGRALVNKEILK